MRTLDYDQAHRVVDSNRSLYWDGWDIVAWVRNPNGATNLRGLFRNGKWGITERYVLNDDGTWKVPARHVK